jgi:hypothetical protein
MAVFTINLINDKQGKRAFSQRKPKVFREVIETEAKQRSEPSKQWRRYDRIACEFAFWGVQ